jgi:hypothetical protein
MKVKNAFLYVLIGFSSFVYAQGDPMRGPLNQPSNGVIDGVVVNEELPVSFVKPYEFVRSSDYVFSKRVYSRIDAREKINQSIFLPFDSFDGDEDNGSSFNPANVNEVDDNSWKRDQSNWSLWTVILRHIFLGDLTVYQVSSSNSDVEDGYNLRYPVVKNANYNGNDYFSNSIYKATILDVISANGKGDDLKFAKISDVYDTIRITKTDQTLSVFLDSLKACPDSVDYQALQGIDPADLVAWWAAAKVGQIVKKDYKTMYAASNSVFAYNIKEDWYFDKELSVFEKRIICIAPVARYTYDPLATTTERGDLLVYNNSGKAYRFDNVFEEYTDQWEEREMFWLYFPELRNVIVNYFVSNDKNDSDRMSFDELFFLRYYSGQIYKSSNRYDQEIQDYRHGVDALYEAEKFKDKMRNWEHDVWNF